jgi:diguanylate cyclase (GGDEF)-like protein
LKRIFSPVVRSRVDLARYLALATGTAVGTALLVDVAQQLLFFTDWQTAIRSWVVTILVASVIALPLLGSLGYAHLNLWRAQVQLEILSRTDDLTGLPNRRALLAAFGEHRDAITTLVLIDVDHFKRINDTHGHGVGDAALQLLSAVLAERLGTFGMVGRVGGEEFALVAWKHPAEALAKQLQQLTRHLSDHPFVISGISVPITVSAGVALRQGRDFDTVYQEADRALYGAKHAGRNQIRLAEPLDVLQSPA